MIENLIAKLADNLVIFSLIKQAHWNVLNAFSPFVLLPSPAVFAYKAHVSLGLLNRTVDLLRARSVSSSSFR